MGWDNLGKMNLISAGHVIEKPFLIFDKIEDETVNAQVEKLLATKKENEENKNITPEKEAVSFDDFTNMDMRIGTILEAEKVPKTKKLLKLFIDTGIDQRTVVSGIAEFYSPEDIIGKQVCILVNLAPRKIKGIESQGMILMGQDKDGTLSFVQPDKTISNGSSIS